MPSGGEPLTLDANEVAQSMISLTDLHRDILAVETEPDAELLETFRGMLHSASVRQTR